MARRPAGRGHLKCGRCRLTFPPPGYAREAWKKPEQGLARYHATCPHCGHVDGYVRADATW